MSTPPKTKSKPAKGKTMSVAVPGGPLAVTMAVDAITGRAHIAPMAPCVDESATPQMGMEGSAMDMWVAGRGGGRGRGRGVRRGGVSKPKGEGSWWRSIVGFTMLALFLSCVYMNGSLVAPAPKVHIPDDADEKGSKNSNASRYLSAMSTQTTPQSNVTLDESPTQSNRSPTQSDGNGVTSDMDPQTSRSNSSQQMQSTPFKGTGDNDDIATDGTGGDDMSQTEIQYRVRLSETEIQYRVRLWRILDHLEQNRELISERIDQNRELISERIDQFRDKLHTLMFLLKLDLTAFVEEVILDLRSLKTSFSSQELIAHPDLSALYECVPKLKDHAIVDDDEDEEGNAEEGNAGKAYMTKAWEFFKEHPGLSDEARRLLDLAWQNSEVKQLRNKKNSLATAAAKRSERIIKLEADIRKRDDEAERSVIDDVESRFACRVHLAHSFMQYPPHITECVEFSTLIKDLEEIPHCIKDLPETDAFRKVVTSFDAIAKKVTKGGTPPEEMAELVQTFKEDYLPYHQKMKALVEDQKKIKAIAEEKKMKALVEDHKKEE
eukprot:GHVO01064035.1.p1 GENE.GHVO01064035.1~~GHVO01064035.1.p1  ORF type:complete len:557 (-),score=81.99 GHVO01064035.1:103-1749(-)